MFVKENSNNQYEIVRLEDSCFCGATMSQDKENYGYCDECAKKRSEFIKYIVSDYNCGDIGAFEYIITNASEKLRKRDMSLHIGYLVDNYMVTNGDLDPYNNPIFVESVLVYKVEELERFLDVLATRDRDMSLISSFEFYYQNYEKRIREDISVTRKVIDSMREGIVNPFQKALTNS